MICSFHPYVYSLLNTVLMLLVSVLMLPQHVQAECKEFKIVEYDDRVEVVCVGEPLTDAQKKKNLEEEQRQELDAQRQRAEVSKREATAASKAQASAKTPDDSKRRNMQPATPQKPANKNNLNLQPF